MPEGGAAGARVLCCVLACCLPTLPTCRSEVRGTASSTGAGCFVYLDGRATDAAPTDVIDLARARRALSRLLHSQWMRHSLRTLGGRTWRLTAPRAGQCTRSTHGY